MIVAQASGNNRCSKNWMDVGYMLDTKSKVYKIC